MTDIYLIHIHLYLNYRKNILYIFTVTKPSNHNIGSVPMEKINRNIVEATNVRIPDSRGNITLITANENITIHMIPEKCELSSEIMKK